ncbi:glycosyltransferase [Desulfovibrio desulfuricans]|uniref:glycosyltransferase n=1 Tax=Desulfovibrio desulfuricans TaxID=876 RepID=UPI001C03513A|nr:glycosyltransferase [Desulfovibrio desulfuricans]MBT9749012.1 glycosyltransferase [Desulfovibrio desulfuricans]
MNNNSILLTTYPDAFLHKGGGEYEILEVGLNLRKLGFTADVYSPYSNSIENYDNVLHFSVNESGLHIFKTVKKYVKNAILWPNFWDIGESFEPSETIKKFIELSDLIVFKSNSEKEHFTNIFSIPPQKILTIPVGVDPSFATPPPPFLFRESFKIHEYILWIGIIEPIKNQLTAIKALKNIGIPLVFIGSYRDKSYFEACKNAAPEDWLFLGPIEHKSDLFRAAISECRLYIEPSLEPAGKSALEACVCGAHLVVSDGVWEREQLGNAAIFVNPLSPDSILKGVQQALKKTKNANLNKKILEKHLYPNSLANLVTAIKNL